MIMRQKLKSETKSQPKLMKDPLIVRYLQGFLPSPYWLSINFVESCVSANMAGFFQQEVTRRAINLRSGVVY